MEDKSPELILPKELTLKFSGRTEPSVRHPERNEDAIWYDPKSNLAMVLDGVGGGPAGEDASTLALKVLKDKLSKLTTKEKMEKIEDEMKKVFLDASKQVSRKFPGGGTTAVAAKIVGEGVQKTAVIASVGDSRAYLFSNGSLERVTEDDGFFDPETSKKFDDVISISELSDFEAAIFKRRNIITQSIGGEIREVHLCRIDLVKGDRLVLTTDGVHDNLTTSEIEEVISTGGDIAGNLVGKAKARSVVPKSENIRAKKDDISAVVVEVE